MHGITMLVYPEVAKVESKLVATNLNEFTPRTRVESRPNMDEVEQNLNDVKASTLAR